MSQKYLPSGLEVYGVRMGYTVVSHVPFSNVSGSTTYFHPLPSAYGLAFKIPTLTMHREI
jgi:hypothetical protein